jgi:SAM-dependent methyltransferase
VREWIDRYTRSNDVGERVRLYDDLASTWDADTVAAGYVSLSLAAAMLRRFVQAGSVLDAGCGTGGLGMLLDGYDLVGIDFSPKMVEHTRQRGVYRAVERMTLGERLAFNDARFDAVVALGVLAGGHAPPEALDELLRVSKPGAHLIFTMGTEAHNHNDKREELESAGRWTLVEATDPYHPMPQLDWNHRVRMFAYRSANAVTATEWLPPSLRA